MFQGTWLTLKAYFRLYGQDSELSGFEQFHGCHPHGFTSTPKERPGKVLVLNGAVYLVTKDMEKPEAVDAFFTSVL